MKTMILAAVAALGVGVGAAYAQGVPARLSEPAYGSQAFSDHRNEASVQFLGKGTVLGKMFNHSSSDNAGAATSTTTGG